VTHPFHPWRGQQFEFVDCRRCWGQWRVFYYTEDGQSAFFPAGWTDAGQADPFVVLSGGQALYRFEDLLRLVKLIEGLKGSTVKKIRPYVQGKLRRNSDFVLPNESLFLPCFPYILWLNFFAKSNP
jgi:hypothetical protein